MKTRSITFTALAMVCASGHAVAQTPQAPTTAPAAPIVYPVAPAAPATALPEAAEPEEDDGQIGNYQQHNYAQIGARVLAVTDSSLDWFSENRTLPFFTLGFGRAFALRDNWSIAASANWDFTAISNDLRGSATNLTMHRLTLAPELRHHLLRRLYAFARVGAGVGLLDTSVHDDVVGSDREHDAALFTLDASIGAAFQFFGARAGKARGARGWVQIEGGYLFTSASHLRLRNSQQSPARSSTLDLGRLALGGPGLRAVAAVSF